MKRACELIYMALCLFTANGFGDVVDLKTEVSGENRSVVDTAVTTNTTSNGHLADDGFTYGSTAIFYANGLLGDCGTETNDNTMVVFKIPQEEVADLNLSLTANLISNSIGVGKSTPISSVYKNSESESLAFAAHINDLMTYRGSEDDSLAISFNPEGFFTKHSDGAKFGAVTMLFTIKYEF